MPAIRLSARMGMLGERWLPPTVEGVGIRKYLGFGVFPAIRKENDAVVDNSRPPVPLNDRARSREGFREGPELRNQKADRGPDQLNREPRAVGLPGTQAQQWVSQWDLHEDEQPRELNDGNPVD
jgi:hypothetical protein